MGFQFSFPIKNPRIILASGSQTRLKILKDAGIIPHVFSVDCPEETLKKDFLAKKYALKEISALLAEAKAKAALKILQKKADYFENPPLIIGADQILECENKLYNKPKNMAQAREQLFSMRGKRQFLHTSFCLIQEGKEIFHYTESPKLKMRMFSEEMLSSFLAFEGEELLFCVGACRIEGVGAQLFEFVEGAKETILGLPLFPLLTQLRERNFIPD
ncbi:hypothetical protein FAI41_05145 [Acetobacteraceae bacterium]|nr:hypothetical protein FAI41_05145 [Acetobacteraceae bacterium]